jgi:hypothetical protein
MVVPRELVTDLRQRQPIGRETLDAQAELGATEGAVPPATLALLCECVRERPSVEALRSTLEHIGDWTHLVEAADHHGVASLVHRALEQTSTNDAVPAHVAARLFDAHRDSAKRGMVFSAALAAVHDTLRAAGILALPLKGPVLAATLYPDPALRPFSDIDVLVRPADLPAALRALARIGWMLDRELARVPVRTLLTMSTEAIVRGPDGVPLDLHWELAPRGYPFRFDPALLFGSVRAVRFEGRDLPGLAPEALLVFLCMHGAKHAWSRLMWICDVARLGTAGFDAVAALRFADRAGCTRPTLMGLLLAHELLAAPVAASIIERARAEPGLATLARMTVLRLGRSPSDERRYEDLSFNAMLANSGWARAKHYATLLAPSEAELRRLSLPAPLSTLYYPFRLARLATKYTMKLAGTVGAPSRTRQPRER